MSQSLPLPLMLQINENRFRRVVVRGPRVSGALAALPAVSRCFAEAGFSYKPIDFVPGLAFSCLTPNSLSCLKV